MSWCIVSLTASYHPLPLKNPFVLSIRTATNANVIRWRMGLDDGSEYLGECVPVQYVTGETLDSVLEIAPLMERLLQGRKIKDVEAIIDSLFNAFPLDVAARAGVEIALFNAFAGEREVPLHRIFGKADATLETDLTISRIPNAVEVASGASKEGFRIFKVKVGGGSMEEDIDRILGIASAVPDAIFRLDANQALTVESTLELVTSLLQQGTYIELIEQPVPKADLAALDEVSRISPVSIIADESCCSPSDALRLFSETSVHGVNVKLMKSGISGALDIIRIAQSAGKKLMIGCMLESEVGIAASVALACGTGAFDYVDLDGHLLIDIPTPITLFDARGPYLRTLPTGE